MKRHKLFSQTEPALIPPCLAARTYRISGGYVATCRSHKYILCQINANDGNRLHEDCLSLEWCLPQDFMPPEKAGIHPILRLWRR